jgi:K+-sensing histidine kinase KdpD
LEGRASGDTYILKVCDDGEGVPDLVQDRLFERFIHRGRETAGRQSVGLGLSIVMALAVGMGGNVFYERSDGVTAFAIALPLASEDVLPRTRTAATRLAS